MFIMDTRQRSSTAPFSCTRAQIFEVITNISGSSINPKLSALEIHVSKKTKHPFTFDHNEKEKVRKMLSKMRKKWQEAHRRRDIFFKKNEEWLNVTTTFTNSSKNIGKNEEFIERGQPSADFMDASVQTKRRRATDLRAAHSTQKLAFATQMLLRPSGAVHAASVLNDITTKSLTRASKYKAALKLTQASQAREMTGDEALLDLVTAKLTKQRYTDIRNSLKKKNFKAYPSYSEVAEAKARCYPSGILVSETSASVELQALLDHTCSRIIMLQKEVLGSLDPQAARDLTLICKWGCDGSSGQSQYKQKFQDEASSDAHIFLTSLVPLQMVGSDVEKNKNLIVWKNPRPSSPRFCRPIRVQFMKETSQSTLAEQQYVNDQIESLNDFHTCVNGTEVIVKYKLFFTMIDGKVCNSVTGTSSSMRCYLCGANSKHFNNIKLMKSKKVDNSQLGLGCSTLHAWIRFFECFLHIGYKSGNQQLQARKTVDKELVKKRKNVIQNALEKELSPQVDKPKAGFGSSNDGNTARRFFENTSVSARILGVDESLLERCHVILQVMSSGFAVNVCSFKQYCLETAELFVTLYPWFCMPTTIHEVLIHGHLIVEWAPLPIGQMLEDAQEARNKDIKNYRENVFRKCSREKTMTNIFNGLLVTSDPFITSMGKNYPKKNKNLSSKAMRLLFSSDDVAEIYGNAESVETDTNSSDSDVASEDSEESD